MYIIERKNSLLFTLVYVMTLALSRLHTFFVRVSLKMVLRSLKQWGLVLQGTNNITITLISLQLLQLLLNCRSDIV